MTKNTNKEFIISLAKELKETNKRNKQLLITLRLAKKEIKFWYNEAHGNMGEYFWTDYQKLTLPMQRINKAIKDGHNR